MNPSQTVDTESDSLNSMLTAAVLQNQQQLERLERSNRLLLMLMLFMTVGLLAGGYSLLGSSQANASGQSLLQRAEQEIQQDFQRAAQWERRETGKLQSFEQKSKAEFENTIEKVRTDLTKAGNFEPLHAVAVILKDMKAMLEAVPRMADNMETMTTAMTQMNQKMSAMPNMAVDMHQMNYNMAVIAEDIDDTMGRMGRMAPW